MGFIEILLYSFMRGLIFGRGCELLKTVSTKISIHFPKIWETYLLFRNWSLTQGNDLNFRRLFLFRTSGSSINVCYKHRNSYYKNLHHSFLAPGASIASELMMSRLHHVIILKIILILYNFYYYGSAEGHEYPDLYKLSDNYR